MKKTIYIIAGILIALLVLSFFKDTIIKISVEKIVANVTGLRLKIKSMKVGILNSSVSIKGLRVFNPKNFPDKLMVDMPKIYVLYDLGAIMGGKIHLKDLNLDLKEFTVVKNSDGQLNLNSLKVVQAQKTGAAPQGGEQAKVPEIQIDTLELKIGKVIYKDYSAGAIPVVKEYDINLNEQYTNITNPYTLVSLIVVKALMNTSIAGLANFDLQDMKGTINNTLNNAKNVKKVVDQTRDMVKDASGMLKDVFGRTLK